MLPNPINFIGFGAMDATKPYKFIGFGAMDATKPYKFIGFGAMDATKPYKFIGFGAMDAGLRSGHRTFLPSFASRPQATTCAPLADGTNTKQAGRA